jgi:hypothetical protein
MERLNQVGQQLKALPCPNTTPGVDESSLHIFVTTHFPCSEQQIWNVRCIELNRPERTVSHRLV